MEHRVFNFNQRILVLDFYLFGQSWGSNLLTWSKFYLEVLIRKMQKILNLVKNPDSGRSRNYLQPPIKVEKLIEKKFKFFGFKPSSSNPNWWFLTQIRGTTIWTPSVLNFRQIAQFSTFRDPIYLLKLSDFSAIYRYLNFCPNLPIFSSVDPWGSA